MFHLCGFQIREASVLFVLMNNNFPSRLSNQLPASWRSFWCSEAAEAVRGPFETPPPRPTHTASGHLALSSRGLERVQVAASSSRSVVGKSRTTGSFEPTRVSSTIAKHCGRVHQRLRVTAMAWPASMVTTDRSGLLAPAGVPLREAERLSCPILALHMIAQTARDETKMC